MSEGSLPESIAAVDLGSNSFHMVVAQPRGYDFKVVDRMREPIRLAAGLDDRNNISPAAIERALGCLERFGERVGGFSPGSVRVVGTNTLRKARNAQDFIHAAEDALGHPIDIVSGHEEARLIYLGVSHGLADNGEMRLVVDIGGGSTELILGRRFEPEYTESLHMGCVSMTSRFFGDGKIDRKRMRAAVIAARQEFEPVEETLHLAGWQSALGASGTILAIRDIVITQAWSAEGITPAALSKLVDATSDARSADGLGKLGVSVDRRPVFAGGVAILRAAFEALRIGQLMVSQSALREGLLYDLLGRIHDEDVRDRTVESLIERYHLDRSQGVRISATAQMLWRQVAAEFGISSEEHGHLLHRAALLHEIGQSISHSQYHKHSAYLLRNLEMPGFARGEQRRLAILVRAHRRKMPLADIRDLPHHFAQQMLRIALVFRLAVVLHRRRSASNSPPVTLSAEHTTLRLRFPRGWLEEHPLTYADLEQEAAYVKTAGYKLKFK